MIHFEPDTGNGEYDFNHWYYNSRFVCVTINEDVKHQNFEVNIHPNVDKGYRDPYEVKSFQSLDEAKTFANEYITRETK